MARGRLISRTLGSSRKFAALPIAAGKLAEFAQSLYPMLVANSDDFGRMDGDPFTVKHAVFPTSARKEDEFRTALDALRRVGLIALYEVGDRIVLQIMEFDKHQPGLHRRTESEFPAMSDERSIAALPPINASERQIEDFLAVEIRSGRLSVGNHRIVSVQQQVRIRQFYLDIVAKTDRGTTIVIEVKRQRVTSAAIEQVRGYVGLIDGAVEAIVIGHGLAAGFDSAVSDVLIGVYDHAMKCRAINADTCSRTFQHVPEIPAEFKGIEEKGIEEKQTPPLMRRASDPVPDGFEVFWLAYPKKRAKATAERAWRRLEPSPALLQRILDAIAMQRNTQDWVKDDGRYVPHPATWLNAKRWQDEEPIAVPEPSVPVVDWFEECQRVHGGACGLSQFRHHLEMQKARTA
jgi:hypothetical protein